MSAKLTVQNVLVDNMQVSNELDMEHLNAEDVDFLKSFRRAFKSMSNRTASLEEGQETFDFSVVDIESKSYAFRVDRIRTTIESMENFS